MLFLVLFAFILPGPFVGTQDTMHTMQHHATVIISLHQHAAA